MHIDVLTLFPGMFHGPLTESILGRASHVVPPGGTMRDRQDDKLIDVHLHDLRQWGKGKYKQVDDRPYGGGAGMVMRADVVVPAIEAVSCLSALSRHRVLDTEVSSSFETLRGPQTLNGRPKGERLAVSKDGHSQSSKLKAQSPGPHRIFLTPRGRRLTQARVERLTKKPWLLLLCGHYEGVDQRVVDGGWIDEELSIGDYVLTGGELPAMVLIDAVARHIPGVLGKGESADEESFSGALGREREYPHYTRPEEFCGVRVPDILLGGHHAEVRRWRQEHSG